MPSHQGVELFEGIRIRKYGLAGVSVALEEVSLGCVLRSGCSSRLLLQDHVCLRAAVLLTMSEGLNP